MLQISQLPHYGTLTEAHNNLVQKALNFAKQSQKSTDSQHQINISSPVLTQYYSILSRIYVGSVNFELKEAELATLFCQFGSIKNINLAYEGSTSIHKGYGFVEFDTPEAAQLAIDKMEGVACAGRGFKMGRPSTYFQELPSLLPPAPITRIYLANIHEYINEQDLQELCSVFGPVRTLCLAADPTTKRHKGYCYVEYEEERNAKRAIAHLNNLPLAGFVLHATKALTGMPLPLSLSSLSKRSTSLPTKSDATNAKPQQPAGRKNPLISLADSPVVLLRSISYEHEIDENFESDIKDEMNKYGYIQSMHFFTDDRRDSQNAIHVFVCYDYVASADEAIHKMNGRWFGGRQVEALKYPLIRYQIKDFYC